MAEANGKLAELWDLPEDLLGDEMNTSVLWPEVYLGLKPAGADLDDAVGGGHVCAGANCVRQTGKGGWRGRVSEQLLTRWSSIRGRTTRRAIPGGRQEAPFGDSYR